MIPSGTAPTLCSGSQVRVGPGPKKSCVRRLLLVLALLACGCAGSLTSQVSRSLNRASEYLAEKQSEDGAWRSQVYEDQQDGLALTPPITLALVSFGTSKAAQDAARSGLTFLGTMVDKTGLKKPLADPIAAASAAVLTLVRAGGQEDALHAFQSFLRAQQMASETGWSQEDPQFGGWGQSPTIPYKPHASDQWNPASDSNLASTLQALTALRESGASPRDEAVQSALEFVLRCQNFGNSDFDDGGFYDNPTFGPMNKAGGAGTDSEGRTRYLSYGTATADGLRCMLAAGYSPNHPRVVAARVWLEKNFSATQMPGNFPEALRLDRDSLYFTWCCEVAQAMTDLERSGSPSALDWARPLATALLQRQLTGGGWKNPNSASREDDPLVATPRAMTALALARQQLLRQGRSPSPSN